MAIIPTGPTPNTSSIKCPAPSSAGGNNENSRHPISPLPTKSLLQPHQWHRSLALGPPNRQELHPGSLGGGSLAHTPRPSRDHSLELSLQRHGTEYEMRANL